MIKYIIIFNFLIITDLLLHAGSNNGDSLVKYKDISFSTDYEKQVLCKYFKTGIPDYFRLFIAASKDIDFKKADKYLSIYINFYKNLCSKKFLKYNPKRKIKVLYRTAHNTYFNKYEFNTSFDKIFQNGDYNCVTASAFYGIILNQLNIPFFIVETPLHVYPVANLDNKHIKIEPTGPITGYFVYNQNIKRTFIEYFKSSKLIDEKEYYGSSVDELFDKYYFHGNKISLKELLGIQYMNNAAYDILENNIIESYNCLEKAYLFYPSEDTRKMLFNYLINIIPALDYDNPEDLDYLVKLTRYSSHELIKKTIKSEFLKITENCLINKSDLDYYEYIYKYFSEEISNDEYLKEISFIYYYEKGKFLISDNKQTDGHNYLLKALELRINDKDIQSAFIHSLTIILEQLEIYNAVEKLETYSVQFPELLANQKFIGLIMKNYLEAAIHSIKTNNITTGDAFLKKFESLYKSDSEIFPEENLIGEAFSAASVYYFKKGLYNKAKEYLIKGLTFAPNNTQLKIGISYF